MTKREKERSGEELIIPNVKNLMVAGAGFEPATFGL